MPGKQNSTPPDRRTLVIGRRRVDGRFKPALRYKELREKLARDIGEPTVAQWLMVDRIAGLSVEIELLEMEIAKGKTVDPDHYTRLVGSLMSALKMLGLNAKASSKPSSESKPAPELDAHTQALVGGSDGKRR